MPQAKKTVPMMWVFASMPPPMNGQSVYNQRILRYFTEVTKYDVVAVGYGNTILRKIWQTAYLCFLIVFKVNRSDVIYTSPPGQSGIWLFAVMAFFLKIRNLRYFVHHHSFRPISVGPTTAWRLLIAIGGPLQLHIFLSEEMKRRFVNLYDRRERLGQSFVLPNAFLFGGESLEKAPHRAGEIVIGHLSVLSTEKGVAYLVDLFRSLQEAGERCRLHIAGPVEDQKLESELKFLKSQFPEMVKLLGPLHGEDKNNFYQDVDLFVFPSTLADEADPLVLLEAFNHGCSVLASTAGCIPERVMDRQDLMSLEKNHDITLLKARISAIRHARTSIAESCIDHSRKLKMEAEAHAQRFFGQFDH